MPDFHSAHVRYWLWFTAAMKFLIPFSILVGIGHQFEWRAPPAVPQRPISTIAEISVPFVAMPSGISVPTSAAPKISVILVVLFFVWACCFAVSVLSWIRSWHRIRKALHAASSVYSNLPIDNIPARVVSSPGLLEPAVFGIFKPVLLLPDAIEDHIAPEQLRALLIHELCHIRRCDNLRTVVYMIAETLFWFYPLVRYIGKRLMHERERAIAKNIAYAALQAGYAVMFRTAPEILADLHCDSPQALRRQALFGRKEVPVPF